MKRLVTRIGIGLICLAGMEFGFSPAVDSVQLADGTVYFVQPPRLVRAATTQNSTYVWGATYSFTLDLPETAGEPLQRVVIAQQDGLERVRFNLEETEAIAQPATGQAVPVSLGEVSVDPETRAVSVVFDPPIPPGQTVTVGLRPYQNPGFSGIYLFGVTAFPTGEKAHGQFLGFGRLHFYENRSWFWQPPGFWR